MGTEMCRLCAHNGYYKKLRVKDMGKCDLPENEGKVKEGCTNFKWEEE